MSETDILEKAEQEDEKTVDQAQADPALVDEQTVVDTDGT